MTVALIDSRYCARPRPTRGRVILANGSGFFTIRFTMNRKLALAALLIGGVVGCLKDAGTTRPSSSATTKESAQPATITVDVDRPGAKVNPAMWGAFFEDINFGADGGLYAQMVKNGMFEFPESMMGWIVIRPSLAEGD